jgi:hypothetical protein
MRACRRGALLFAHAHEGDEPRLTHHPRSLAPSPLAIPGVVSSGAAGKALSGLSYNPAIKSLVATLQDGTTVTGDLSSE